MRQRRRNSPDVAITRNADEKAAISEGLNLLQADNLINSNDIVVITPNWVQKQLPQTGTVVGPESLKEIIRFAKAKNPRRIVVATGSGQKNTVDIMNFAGFGEVIKSEEVEFIDLNIGPFIRMDLDHNSPASTSINKLYDEMTFLISFTQLKHHEEATMSAAIKNIAMGWPPAEEHGYPKKNKGIHNDLHGFMRAMAEKIAIDLSIVSANPAMVGTGPGKGLPRHTGVVICGTDPVAVDTIGARLLGFKPQAIHYLYECINRNIGIGDVEKINIKGISLTDAENIFTSTVYGERAAVDSK